MTAFIEALTAMFTALPALFEWFSTFFGSGVV